METPNKIVKARDKDNTTVLVNTRIRMLSGYQPFTSQAPNNLIFAQKFW
jgi:hypothetical protein